MRGILGIDAAWSEKNESGLALIVEGPSGWEVQNACCSVAEFCSTLQNGSTSCPGTTHEGIAAAVRAALSICPDLALIAVDMPLSLVEIRGRRSADTQISKEYGGRHCSTHSPTLERPGTLSSEIVTKCAELGFPLRTETCLSPGLIEVYPHPALVELLNAGSRLKYKVSKMARYFPNLTTSERKGKIEEVWIRIAKKADDNIAGFSDTLNKTIQVTGVSKRSEDLLDALICAWIGLKCLRGQAKPFGNQVAAIWVPFSDCPTQSPT